jgi:hypothetical protein
MIGSYDLVLASMAMQPGSSILIFNRLHFAVVKGLKIIEPELRATCPSPWKRRLHVP